MNIINNEEGGNMKIVFWSGTGNTEKMASVIADGIVKGGKEAELINVSEASNEVFDNEDVVILGCPCLLYTSPSPRDD